MSIIAPVDTGIIIIVSTDALSRAVGVSIVYFQVNTPLGSSSVVSMPASSKNCRVTIGSTP